VRFNTNRNSLLLFGQRLKSIREAAGLSQAQVHDFTGIGRSHIVRIETGTLNTGLHNISILGELFGLEDYELLQYKSPLPNPDILRKNVSKYLKSRKMDPAVSLKQGLVHLIETKLLPSKFFASPRFAKEISEFLKEKDGESFTTSHISQALGGFVDAGRVEKIKTDKKTKYQYRSKV
jgi:transcriptional regulator with XRE-family HTH domain